MHPLACGAETMRWSLPGITGRRYRVSRNISVRTTSKMFEYIVPKAVRAADSETVFLAVFPQAPEAALMIRTMRTEETVTTGMYGMVRSLLQIIRSIIFVSARSLASSLFRA